MARITNVGAIVRGRPGRLIPGGRLGRGQPRPPAPGGAVWRQERPPVRVIRSRAGRTRQTQPRRVYHSPALPRAARCLPLVRIGRWVQENAATASTQAAARYNAGRAARYPGTGRVFRQSGESGRVFRQGQTPARVWRFRDSGGNMDNTTRADETLYMTRGEAKTFGADFSRQGAVAAGGTLSNPRVAIAPAGGPIADQAVILVTDFVDSEGGGPPIPAGKGFSYRLTGGAVGEYDVGCKVDVLVGGVHVDTLELVCRLHVEETVTNA